MVAPAVECHWKPGKPLPEQPSPLQPRRQRECRAGGAPKRARAEDGDGRGGRGHPPGDHLGVRGTGGMGSAERRRRARSRGRSEARCSDSVLPSREFRQVEEIRLEGAQDRQHHLCLARRADGCFPSMCSAGWRERLAFRPRELAQERRDGIFIHLSERTRQRLYTHRLRRLTAVSLCSGASSHQRLPLNQHPDAPLTITMAPFVSG